MNLKALKNLSPKLRDNILSHKTLTTLITSNDINDISEEKKRVHIGGTKKFKVPDNFDGRIVWKNLVSNVVDQNECGACWSVATVNCLQSRFNIQTLGENIINISSIKMLYCYWDQSEFDDIFYDIDKNISKIIDLKNLNKYACNGNSLYNAWNYLYVRGTFTSTCAGREILYKNNILGEINESMSCTGLYGHYGDLCYDGSPGRFFRAIDIYYVAGTPKYGGSEYNIRSDIYEWGPVSTAMEVYVDFYTFNPKKDIYRWDKKSEFISGHAVLIVGWGIENNTKYWIVQNSWGKNWGINGYFKMLRGENECKIEENVIVCQPDFFYPELNENDPDLGVYTFAQSNLATKNRQKIENKNVPLSIDPLSGYSNRCIKEFNMNPKPFLKNQFPMHHWDNFVAGEIKNNTVYKNNIKLNNNNNNNKKYYIYIVIFFIIITIFIIFILYFSSWYKKHT